MIDSVLKFLWSKKVIVIIILFKKLLLIVIIIIVINIIIITPFFPFQIFFINILFFHHSVVFAGFSSEALASRINDGKAKTI